MPLPSTLLICTLVAGLLSCARSGSLTAPSRFPDSLSVADGRLQAAAALYNEGSYARVIDLLQPSGGMILSPRANYYLGSSFAALNDPQNAIRYLRMAVDSSKGETACRFQLARSLSAYGATGDARVQYRLILGRDSAFLPALFNLGTLCFDGRDFAGAADLFTKAVLLNPRDYLSCYNLGASLVNLGKPDSAVQFLRAGLALNVRYVPCLSLLASLYYKRKEYQDAERLYGMIVVRDSLNADFWARRGYCMEKLGEPARAVLFFRNATKLDTSNSTYFARLGQAYFELKEFDSAAVSYLRGASLEEDNPVLFLNAGVAYARMDSLDSALGAFHSSYKASHTERLGFLYSQIGGAYYKQKRFRPAGQAYTKALVYDPLNKRAIFFLAHSLDEIREPGRAAAAYGRFLKAARGDPSQGDVVPYAKKRLRELSGGK